jgi:hypothetical protein
MTATQIFGLVLAVLMLTAAVYAFYAARSLLQDGRERRRYRALVDEDAGREAALRDEMIDLEVDLAMSDLDDELVTLFAVPVTATRAGPVNTMEAPMDDKFEAAALRLSVDDPDVRAAAATLLVTLADLSDDKRQLREGPSCRLKPGAVAAVAAHVAGEFTGAGAPIKPSEVLDALTSSGLVEHRRDGEDDVYTLTARR